MGKETGRLVNRVKGKVQTHFHRRCNVRCRQRITEIRWKRWTLHHRVLVCGAGSSFSIARYEVSVEQGRVIVLISIREAGSNLAVSSPP